MTTRTVPIRDIREHEALAGLPKWADESPEMEALSRDIRERGIDQALVVVPDGEGAWLLVDGRHRLRAAYLAGLETVPCSLRDEAEALPIILNSLVQRRHYTKGALAYVVYPLLVGGMHGRRGRPNTNSLLSRELTADSVAAQLGIGVALWEQAARLHRIFAEDNDYRERMEGKVLAGDVGLGAAIAGAAGDGVDQGATPGKKQQKGRIFAERLKACWNGFFAPGKWERISAAERVRVAAEAGKAIARWPDEVKEEVARALRVRGSGGGRK